MNHQNTRNPARLRGLISPNELHAAVAAGEITTVQPVLPDMMGRLKGKRVDAQTFLERMQSGAEMCAYVLATDVDMTPVPGYALTGWHNGYGDLRACPDLDTIRVLPHLPGTALVHTDAVDADGEMIEVSPRRMLRVQLDRLQSLGLDVQAGLESEFVLYEGNAQQARTARYRRLHPAFDHNGDYSLTHDLHLTGLFQHLEAVLDRAGTPAESLKTEGAPGQVEVAFPYGEPMRACDSYTVYKDAVRHVAELHDTTPTFMAAPATGVGSGLHVHLSLWHKDRNLLAAGPQDETLVPDTMRQALAGLISGLPHVTLLCAPTPNSYKRFRPHSFAPTGFTWGFDNRSCAVRVTGHGEGQHLEIRLPGSDANPYLALSAVLAAVVHGITTQPVLPPPCQGDGYEDADAQPVPRELTEALAVFDTSKVALGALGETVVHHYAHAARHLLREHRTLVTDIELKQGFERA